MKDSEKRLLMIFGVLLLGAAVMVMFKFYRDKSQTLKTEGDNLERRIVEIDELLKNRELWKTRSAWLDKHQPRYTTEEKVKNRILEDAEAKGVAGVTTSNQQLMDEVELKDEIGNTHYIQVGATLTATGSLEAVFRWLYELQRPGEFRVVSDLRVDPDKDDDSKIVCKFNLLRWYAPNEDTP